jgi:hypothetical protein
MRRFQRCSRALRWPTAGRRCDCAVMGGEQPFAVGGKSPVPIVQVGACLRTNRFWLSGFRRRHSAPLQLYCPKCYALASLLCSGQERLRGRVVYGAWLKRAERYHPMRRSDWLYLSAVRARPYGFRRSPRQPPRRRSTLTIGVFHTKEVTEQAVR